MCDAVRHLHPKTIRKWSNGGLMPEPKLATAASLAAATYEHKRRSQWAAWGGLAV